MGGGQDVKDEATFSPFQHLFCETLAKTLHLKAQKSFTRNVNSLWLNRGCVLPSVG